MSLHKNMGYANVHVAHSLEFPSSVERLAFAAQATDIGRLARQQNDGTFWILIDDAPLTWREVAAAGFATDEFVKVSANDTTPGTLLAKLVQGANVTFTENNDGGNETLTIAAAPGSGFDMRDMTAFDHFMSSTDLTQRIGSLGWNNLVTGTGSDLVFGSEAGHPGIMDGGAGSTAAGRASVFLGSTALPLILLSGVQNQIDMEWLIRLNAAALLSLNNERFTVGFGDAFDAAAGVEHANGVYLEFDPLAHANFRLVTKSAGVATRTATTIAPVADTWYRVGLQITRPGGVSTAKLFINGVERASATANFPVLGLGIGIRLDANVNTAEPRWQADYMQLVQVSAKET